MRKRCKGSKLIMPKRRVLCLVLTLAMLLSLFPSQFIMAEMMVDKYPDGVMVTPGDVMQGTEPSPITVHNAAVPFVSLSEPTIQTVPFWSDTDQVGIFTVVTFPDDWTIANPILNFDNSDGNATPTDENLIGTKIPGCSHAYSWNHTFAGSNANTTYKITSVSWGSGTKDFTQDNTGTTPGIKTSSGGVYTPMKGKAYTPDYIFRPGGFAGYYGDVFDYKGEGHVQTTYVNDGWFYAIHGKANPSDKFKVPSGYHVWVSTKQHAKANLTEIMFTIYNYGNANPASNPVNLSLGADVMINGNDAAHVLPIPGDKGFYMTGNDKTLALINMNESISDTRKNWWGPWIDANPVNPFYFPREHNGINYQLSYTDGSHSALVTDRFLANDDRHTTEPYTAGDSAAEAKIRNIQVPQGTFQTFSMYIGVGNPESINTAIKDVTGADVGVAKIGSTFYSSLQMAVNAANANQTITLLKHVEEAVKVNKTIAIDGGGTSGGDNFAPSSITVNSDVTLTLKNMDFSAANPAANPNIILQNNGKLAFQDTSITGASIEIDSAGSHINVNGSTSPDYIEILKGDAAVIGQILVSSMNTTPPDMGKFAVSTAGFGLFADGTYLKLGKKVTHVFSGMTGGGDGNGNYTFVADGSTVRFGDQLPDPGSDKVWKATIGGITVTVNANTIVPLTTFTATAETITDQYPIEISVGGISYFYTSFGAIEGKDSDEQSVTTSLAIHLASGDGTVILHSDVILTEPITLPVKNVTLRSKDKGNFTITAGNFTITADNSSFPDSSMIVVPTGGSLTIGDPTTGTIGADNKLGTADDTCKPAINGVSFNGSAKAAKVIENHGTLVLNNGSIITGKADSYAVYHTSGEGKEALTIDGANFKIADVIYLAKGTNVYSVGRPRNIPVGTTGNILIIELASDFNISSPVAIHEGFDDTKPAGQKYTYEPGRYSNLSGTILLKNSGAQTLTQRAATDGDATGGEDMIVTTETIKAMRPGSDIDARGVLALLEDDRVNDGYTYNYETLDGILDHHKLYSTPGKTLYIVGDKISVSTNTVIPHDTSIKGADRTVGGSYGADITITNIGSPTGSRTVMISGCPLAFETASDGDPKFNYGKALEDYVAMLSIPSDQRVNVTNLVNAAKKAIAALVSGKATYGDIANIINIHLKEIDNAVFDISTTDTTLTIHTTSADYSYAVLIPGTDTVVGKVPSTSAIGWQNGSSTGSGITFTDLTPGALYEVVAASSFLSGDGAKLAAAARPGAYVLTKFTGVTGAITAGSPVTTTLTFTPTDTNTKYAVADGNGNIIGNGDGAWKNGTGAVGISFTGLTPGALYKVIAVPKNLPDSGYPTDNQSDTRGVWVMTPVIPLSSDKITSGTTSLTISPTVLVEYALRDDNGEIVKYGSSAIWKKGSTNGSITFTGLEEGRQYQVIIRPVLPSGFSSSDVTRVVADGPVACTGFSTITGRYTNGFDTAVTVGAVVSGHHYAAVDSDGKVVAIATGTAVGSPVTTTAAFTGLDAGSVYTIIASKSAFTVGNTGFGDIPGAKIIAPVSHPAITPGVNRLTVTNSNSNYQYAVLDSTGKITINWTNGTGNNLIFSPLAAGVTYKVVVRANPAKLIIDKDRNAYPVYAADGTTGTPTGETNELTIAYTSGGAAISPSPLASTTVSAFGFFTVATSPSSALAGYNKFGGWRDSTGVYQPGERYMAGTDNIALAAVWMPIYTVTGKAAAVGGAHVSGGSITLTNSSGSVTTTSTGAFSIPGITPGTYEMVITNGNATTTLLITIPGTQPGGSTVDIGTLTVLAGSNLPNAGDLSARVTTAKINAQEIAVGGLGTTLGHTSVYSDDDKNAVGRGSSMELLFTGTEKDESDTAISGDVAKIQGKMTETENIGVILDLLVEKKVTESGSNEVTSTFITETPNLLSIYVALPSSLQGMKSYRVYLVHGNGNAEYLYLSNGTTEGYRLEKDDTGVVIGITIFAKRFSTYALSYSQELLPDLIRPEPPSGSSGGGSSGNALIDDTNEDDGNKRVSGLLITEDHIAYMMGRSNNMFAPQAEMTRAEVAQMFYNLLRDKNVAITKGFPDVEGNAWYARAINVLASLGILNGFTDGTFRPDESISRAQFATITIKFAELSQGNIRFIDVPEDHWAYAYVNTAANFGWISGTGNGRFEPDRGIVRAEAVTMVNKMLHRYPDKAFIDNSATIKRFADVDKTHWAYYNIMEASNAHDYEKEGIVETWK